MRSLVRSSKTIVLISFILTFGMTSPNTFGHFNMVYSQGNESLMEDDGDDQIITNPEISDQDNGTKFSDNPVVRAKIFK
jgi:hypothetical protein